MRTSRGDRLRRKSLIFALIAILSNVAGNVLLGAGMHQAGPTVTLSPLAYLRLLADPLVISGVALLAIWFFANLSLLSWADLSYVLPVTAGGYALAAIVGWAALREEVSLAHWLGVALISVGAVMVGRTRPHEAT